mgnify:CR=1 FL=1
MIRFISCTVAKAINQAELKAKFAEKGIDLVASSNPEELGNLIKSEVSRLQETPATDRTYIP